MSKRECLTISSRWQKIWRDLRATSTRTILVVLSIAVGVFAFGVILTTRTVIERELRQSFLAIDPASAIITTTTFDDDLVAAVARLPGVAIAEGRRVVQTIATLSNCYVVGNDVQVTLTDTNR